MNRKKSEKDKKIIFFLDFALVIGISFLLYFALTFLKVPIWLTLAILVIWGTISGFKPSLFRKPFSFLYPKE